MTDIFEYTDFRKYLSDLYQDRKAINRAFSYRLIAQKAGLASPSFIGKILSGMANISHQTLMRLCDVFQIIGTEAEYFELMVNFEGSRSDTDKSHYFQRMQAMRSRHGKSSACAQDTLTSAWYVSPILTLIELGLFHGDHAALGRMLTPPITAQESRLAIELLILQGKIRKDANGRNGVERTPGLDRPPTPQPPPADVTSIPLDTETLLKSLPAGTATELRERIKRAHCEVVYLLLCARGP